jgi:predicted transcriptional regulator
MSDIEQTDQTDLTTLTVDLLSAYFASNSIASDNLAELIKTTHAALKEIGAPTTTGAAVEHVPAVSVRKSLSSPDHIISLIDGKPYKTLKRHLGTHGLTPAEYRERYKLPHDYPLVAKSYSDHRRKVAEQLGLGRSVKAGAKPNVSAAASGDTTAVDTSVPEATTAKKVGSATKSKNTPKTAAPAPSVTASVTADEATAAVKPPVKKKLGIAIGSKPAATGEAATKKAPARRAKAPSGDPASS